MYGKSAMTCFKYQVDLGRFTVDVKMPIIHYIVVKSNEQRQGVIPSPDIITKQWSS
jgi:hypothetical protein